MQPTIYRGLLLNVKDDEWKMTRNKKYQNVKKINV